MQNKCNTQVKIPFKKILVNKKRPPALIVPCVVTYLVFSQVCGCCLKIRLFWAVYKTKVNKIMDKCKQEEANNKLIDSGFWYALLTDLV